MFNEIEELKFKESDRLKAMQEGLLKMKINNYLDGNTFFIEGMGQNYKSPNFLAETYYDHRIAMSFSILSLLYENKLIIDNESCISISYPDFKKHLETLSILY